MDVAVFEMRVGETDEQRSAVSEIYFTVKLVSQPRNTGTQVHEVRRTWRCWWLATFQGIQSQVTNQELEAALRL